MITPPIAGPMARAAFTTTLFSVTALAMSAGPTISITKVCRLGLSSAVTAPKHAAITYTIHSSTAPVIVSTPSVSARRPAVDWVIMISLRFSNRSAMTPPNGARISVGRNCIATTVPSAVPLPVSSSTSQAWAMPCIHVPLNDTI